MKRISFSYPLPQAIREGRKTQTRREVKPQPIGQHFGVCTSSTDSRDIGRFGFADGDRITANVKCPYKVGDVLAVLEEHYMFGHWEPDNTRKRKSGRQAWKFVQDSQEVLYRENPPPAFRKGRHSADPSTPAWHKRLARFMPAHAVRTYIQLTNSKVEQLGDIKEKDAIAEGTEWIHPFNNPEELNELERASNWINCFIALWESINGKDSWNANLWVWVYEFKQVEKPVI